MAVRDFLDLKGYGVDNPHEQRLLMTHPGASSSKLSFCKLLY